MCVDSRLSLEDVALILALPTPQVWLARVVTLVADVINQASGADSLDSLDSSHAPDAWDVTQQIDISSSPTQRLGTDAHA
ncbi:hypothetical protein N7462_010835 [Penicillium macrosclerotiorum]|uniref:uncharacterized protein n=1 Tax=Penicillium macrosclerotiorum TaxID=303699 RepID=UPI0025479C59|nr:uncharacterized protein N7462_010835 [Penicillium macrosclerotiorum]KAJ5669765.1 hypothetical protein N7462_010835 [Penicillium macrosclerotiorum]